MGHPKGGAEFPGTTDSNYRLALVIWKCVVRRAYFTLCLTLSNELSFPIEKQRTTVVAFGYKRRRELCDRAPIVKLKTCSVVRRMSLRFLLFNVFDVDAGTHGGISHVKSVTNCSNDKRLVYGGGNGLLPMDSVPKLDHQIPGSPTSITMRSGGRGNAMGVGTIGRETTKPEFQSNEPCPVRSLEVRVQEWM